jgi:hypothetical protein
VRDFDTDGPRSQGPSVVWAGLADGPALVVVDPSGAAKHDELPATWHGLAEEYKIVWCRVPASDRLPEDVEDVLETLAQEQTRVDLVAAGTTCDAAISLAAQFAAAVRSVLLVDPTELPGDPAATSELADAGVRTRVVARSHAGATDRVPPPLPLGHPEVVAGVRAALVDADQAIADSAWPV